MLMHVEDVSQIAQARRLATQAAAAADLGAELQGRVALVVTEMASNLLKHAVRGIIAFGPFADSTGRGLDVVALDKGKGIADVARAMVDGFSTTGTPGSGLGAIRRQASLFEIYTRPQVGTAVLARFVADSAPMPGAVKAVVAGIVSAYPGEIVSGDAWAGGPSPVGPTLMLADGSGHGSQAAMAADVAVQTYSAAARESCVHLVELMHQALAPTRGAAVAVARFEREAGLVRFVGLGNVTGAVVVNGKVQRMISHNGIAGHVAPRIREFVYPVAGAPLVLLHSDGLSAKWDLAAYPGLAAAHPAIIAGMLCRDFYRNRDDVSIVVMRAAA